MRRGGAWTVAVLLGLVGVSGVSGPGGGAADAASASSAASSASAASAASAASGVPAAEIASSERAGGRWLWPIAPPALLRGFEAPPTPYAAGHRGIDLRAVPGSPVTAPSSATVQFAGIVVDRRVLTLDHGDGVLSSYEPLLPGLAVGDAVAAGDELGKVDSGGHCAAACLH
ncbi:MAG: peptidoglycan DD-metalloendopeptidase family protein, partial [Microbacteriaceae bacterium]|nr:peptidoglycan DD-metalloendopeptidase family protein [Microbacteriaceae bacterium]